MARHHRLRTAVMAAVVGVLALALTGCGAVINTVLTLSGDSGGRRVMTLTLPASEMESAKGGPEAVEASIARHMPTVMEFSGLAETSDKKMIGVFTIVFKSEEEYAEKVTKILAVGQRAIIPEIALATPDTDFVSGASLEENFTSADLLAWLPNGLVLDGVVTEGDSSSVMQLGASRVVFNGQTYEARNTIDFNRTSDFGFSSVAIETTLRPAEALSRTITYQTTSDNYIAKTSLYDDYLAKVVPDGGSMEQERAGVGEAVVWKLTFQAGSPDELKTLTDVALSSTQSEVTISEELLADEPTILRSALTDYAECTAICSPKAGPVSLLWAVPSDWQPVSVPSNGSFSPSQDQGLLSVKAKPDQTYSFDHAIPVRSISATTKVGLTGSMGVDVVIIVDRDNVELAQGGFEQVLAPDPSIGSLTSSPSDDTVTYTVRIDGETVEDYAAKIGSYLPGATVSVASDPSAGVMTSAYAFYQSLPMGDLVPGSVEQPVSFQVDLPFAHTADPALSSPDVTIDGGSVAWTSKTDATVQVAIVVRGMSLAGWIIIAVIGLVVVAVIVLLVVFRHRIKAGPGREGQLQPTVAVPEPVTMPEPVTLVADSGLLTVPASEAIPEPSVIPESVAKPEPGVSPESGDR